MNTTIIPCDIQELLNPIDRADRDRQIVELIAQAETLHPQHGELPNKAEYQNILEAHRLFGIAHLLRTLDDSKTARDLAEAVYGGVAGKAHVDAAIRYYFGEDAIERIMAGGE